MASNAAQEAAAGLIEQAQDEDAALALAQQYLASQRSGTTSSDAPQMAEEAVEQTPEEDVEEFDLSPELPDDLAAEINTPDFEDEPEPVYAEQEDEDYEAEYEDPAVAAERAKRVKVEKQLAWERDQRLKQSRKNWVEKDGKHFPLADVKAIAEKAQSRREFARLAKEENDRMYATPGVQRMVAAMKEKTNAEEVAETWGKPSTGPGRVPSDAQETQEAIDKARKTGGSRGAITEMLKTGRIRI